MPTPYEVVTESIIKQLESGVAPWRKPWRTEMPANLASKKEYRGINVFLLAFQGYGSRYWLPSGHGCASGRRTVRTIYSSARKEEGSVERSSFATFRRLPKALACRSRSGTRMS